MTLRAKLALALTCVALVPLGVALALPLLQAETRAREEAARRLDAARRQAARLVARARSDAAARVSDAADDLVRDRPETQPLWQGPRAAAPVAAALAARHGLDHLEVRDGEGRLVALAGADPRSDPAVDLALVEEGAVALLPLPYPSYATDRRVAFFARRTAVVRGRPYAVVGGRVAGRPLLDEIHEATDQSVALLDRSGGVLESAGDEPVSPLVGEVPLEGGVARLAIAVPGGDVGATRRALLAAAAGTVPLAVAGALAAAIILAGGIARPIRGLAARADAMASEAAARPLTPLADGDEVRRLEQAFDRMLEALAESERRRGVAERIAAWQQVAQRVAHEVKNPLSPIRLAVENLKRARLRSPEEFGRSFDIETTTILEEVDSLRRLVEEFSAFARLPPPLVAPCDLGAIVTQTLALFEGRVRDIGAEATIADSLGAPVPADAEQIGRVLKNVVANALDALEAVPPGRPRRLEVMLRAVVLPARAGARARFAEIAVRDTGAGFEPEALRRVFEPYFTTRAGRGGTGLGMAIAYRIVDEHGGRIAADGAPGRGAVITMHLPLDAARRA